MLKMIGLIVIAIGVLFDFLGCLGLVRMPDVYNRLQAATKCVTFGTCGILFGAAIYDGVFTATGLKAILAAVFILLTSPVAAHAIARASHRSGVKLCDGSVCDKYEQDIKSSQGPVASSQGKAKE